MIHRLLDQEQPVRRTLAMDPKCSHLLLTWQDKHVLESMDKALEPVSKFTDLISGEDHVTSSTILPTLALFETDIMAAKEGETELTAEMKGKMLADIKERYEGKPFTALLEKSTFLDPRYKTDYMDDEKVEEVKSSIVKEGAKCITDKIPNPYVSGVYDTEEPQPVQQSNKRKFGHMLAKAKKRSQAAGVSCRVQTDKDILKKEINGYMSLDTIPWESDPLVWWQGQAKNFPWLALLARKYLCVCGSSSSSERLFSTAGDIVSPTRNRLKPEKVRMFTFLAKNLE